MKGAICTICERPVEEQFCPSCGQQLTNKKVGYREVLETIAAGFLSWERGLFGTIIQFVKNPFKIVVNYWDGFRGYYFSPGHLIFYSIFILALHVTFIDHRILGFKVDIQGMRSAKAIISPQLVFFLWLFPVVSLSSLILYGKRKRRFPEHFIATSYSFAGAAILTTVIVDLLYLTLNIATIWSTPLFFVWLFTTSARVFLAGKKWWVIVSFAILQLVLTILLFFIVFLSLYLLGWIKISVPN